MRLIDADNLKKPIYAEEDNITGCGMTYDEMLAYNDGVDAAWRKIEYALTIDAVPVRHGHWFNAYPDTEPNPMFMYGICSVCGFEQSISDKLNYCPDCGAKMDIH